MTKTFVGQSTIQAQLDLLLPEVLEKHTGRNFLLRAPSGFGKTILGLKMCNYLCPDRKFVYKIVDKMLVFNQEYWVHFYDEIHLLENPEYLYPIMDSRKHVIIMASNETGILKEALMNRCDNLVFSAYTDEELKAMILNVCEFIPENFELSTIITSCGGNPRIINKTVQNLNLWYRRYGKRNVAEFLEKFLGYRDGLDILSYQYLEFLKRNGGRASIDTISANMHIDKATIFYQVEPILLYQHKIKVTSRGRELW